MIRLINKPITYSRDAASKCGGRAGAGDERSEIRILYFFCTQSIAMLLVIGLTVNNNEFRMRLIIYSVLLVQLEISTLDEIGSNIHQSLGDNCARQLLSRPHIAYPISQLYLVVTIQKT